MRSARLTGPDGDARLRPDRDRCCARCINYNSYICHFCLFVFFLQDLNA